MFQFLCKDLLYLSFIYMNLFVNLINIYLLGYVCFFWILYNKFVLLSKIRKKKMDGKKWEKLKSLVMENN